MTKENFVRGKKGTLPGEKESPRSEKGATKEERKTSQTNRQGNDWFPRKKPLPDMGGGEIKVPRIPGRELDAAKKVFTALGSKSKVAPVPDQKEAR